MSKDMQVIIIGNLAGCFGLHEALVYAQTDKLATTEGASSTKDKQDFTVDLDMVHEVLNNSSLFDYEKQIREELTMKIEKLHDMMQPIVLKDEKPLANMGAYRGYKSHPTKASDRKRFERFNKKRR